MAQHAKRPTHPQSPSTSAAKDKNVSVGSSVANGPAHSRASSPGLLLNLSSEAFSTPERPFIVEYFPTPQQAACEYEVRYAELMRQRKAADKVYRSIRKEWTNKARESGQVISINVAYRTKFCEVLSPLQYVIQVDVAQKLQVSLLEERKMFKIPRIQDGIPVKVREARAVTCLGTAVSTAGQIPTNLLRYDEIGGGAAVGSDTFPNTFGTLGICLRDATNKLCGLTNAHVAGTTRSSDVYQPPANPNRPLDRTGKVSKPAFTNLCDAALFDSVSLPATRRFIEGIPRLRDPSGNPYPATAFRFLSIAKLKTNSFLMHKDVIKIGAASDVTHGKIKDTCMTSPPIAHLPANQFNSTFSNVIAIDNAVDPQYLMEGDSGSVTVYIATENGESFPVVIGLNVATLVGGAESYAFPFGRVLNTLGISAPRPWTPPGE